MERLLLHYNRRGGVLLFHLPSLSGLATHAPGYDAKYTHLTSAFHPDTEGQLRLLARNQWPEALIPANMAATAFFLPF